MARRSVGSGRAGSPSLQGTADVEAVDGMRSVDENYLQTCELTASYTSSAALETRGGRHQGEPRAMPSAPISSEISARASSPKRLAFTISDVVGIWQVRRKIIDYRAGTVAVFEGTAVLTPEGFEEKGRIDLGHAVLNATRVYRLQIERRSIVVRFPDGAEFITVDAKPAQTVRHLCGRDTYEGRFFLVDRDTWAEAWRVTGPQKKYASLSHYRRVPA